MAVSELEISISHMSFMLLLTREVIGTFSSNGELIRTWKLTLPYVFGNCRGLNSFVLTQINTLVSGK